MRKISKTNPIPAGTQNVPVNMPRRLAAQLNELAKRSGISRSKYCAHILNEAVEECRVLLINWSKVRVLPWAPLNQGVTMIPGK